MMTRLAIAADSCLPAYPQAQSNAGEIRGLVADATGSAIGGAPLVAAHPGRAVQRVAETDETGEFIFPLLPPGRYRVRVEARGFTPQVFEGVEVRVGDVFTLPVRLEVGELQQVIEVMAQAPVIDSERTQQATIIDLARIAELPINRRSDLGLALLSPATVSRQDLADGTDNRPAQTPQTGIRFGGGNGFHVDGVENCIYSGGVRLSVRQEAVQEFQINRNSASAGFGWSSGGAAVRTGQRNPNGTPQQARIDPVTWRKSIRTCGSNTLYHAGILQLQRRLRRNFAVTAHDTWLKAIDDFTDFNSDFSPMDQLCKRCERSLSAFHHAHRAVAYALFESPARNPLLRGWNVAPIFMMNSWRPFNLLAGFDVNVDNYTTNARPYPAATSAAARISSPGTCACRGASASRAQAWQLPPDDVSAAPGFRFARGRGCQGDRPKASFGAIPPGELPQPVRAFRGPSATTPLACTSAHDARQFQFAMKIFW